MASGSSGPGQDKTVNKVALCSAIFAGFAYVGYSVVRTAFRRRETADVSYPEGEARLYFRRLSQTTQTDALLGNLDLSHTGRIILRPLSVQERIRELNFRARHFADTMLALQGRSSSSHIGPRSLQCSPWSSPRILSPVDVRHFIASRSSDNLSLVPLDSTGSPIRRRWSRKSLAKKSSPELMVNNSEETDRAIQNISEELKEKLESLSLKGREMDSYEAKTLVALLYASDEGVLERALVTLANLATLEVNQNNLREAGCLLRLQNLLIHTKTEIRLASVRALGNMALNEQNQREMKSVIPLLLSFLNVDGENEKNESGVGGSGSGSGSGDVEELSEAILTTLSNVAVLCTWHDEFSPYLHSLYSLLDQHSLPIKLQSLKLLVNLSTNDDMIPSLLAAQAPTRLMYLLDSVNDVEVLLRLVTLLANLTTMVKVHHLNPIVDLPANDKAPSPETMYAEVLGVNRIERIKEKAKYLMEHHGDSDVRCQARRLHIALNTTGTGTGT